MQLLARVESPDHVCCRYRLAAFGPYFEEAGHQLQLISWPRRWWSRLWIGNIVRSADVVILQRRLLPAWQLLSLRRAARFLAFDFDDAVFLRDSYATKGLYSGRRLRRFQAIVRAADLLIAGNSFLAENAARWTSADRVRVIPTCVNLDRYPLAEHRRSGEGVQLVWVGSSSTLKGLQAIEPLLEAIGQGCHGVRLKLICDQFLQFRNVPVDCCPWSEATESAEIAAADIGISHLPDDDWSRGKCGLKVLQYMAAGLPVVANPVGVQVEMVQHGVNGFLAETPEQWCAAIETLKRDSGLCRHMGQAGRQRVEAEFSVARGAARWLEVLGGLKRRSEAA